MTEVQTVDAKYVFLDIVGFTRGRSVEAQSDIVDALNEIVGLLLHEYDLSPDERIMLPTGDGICLAILRRDPYDIHVRFALDILKGLHTHNINTEDKMRQFEVRIGINSNTDNLVTDINGNRNIAGAGINGAQRVMDSADGNQILVSHAVHEILRHRERYMGAFRSYTAKTKHDERVPVHQLLVDGAPGLSLDEPKAFVTQERAQPKLPEHVAYYLAHAIANHPALVEHKDSMLEDSAVITLLHVLAYDSERESHTTELERVYPQSYKAGEASFIEQYRYYNEQDRHVIWQFARAIQFGRSEFLASYANCFGNDSFGLFDFRVVSDYGRKKLREDWPEIWDEFGLDQLSI